MDSKKIEELINVDILSELGLNNLSEEKKLALLDDMGETIMRGVWLRIADELSEAQAEELEKIMDTDTTGIAYVEYLSKNIPNFEDVVKEEVANYKSQLLAAKGNN